LTETLWQEARKKGIHVFAVHPGPTDTEFSHRAGRKQQRPRPDFVRQVPEEVAAEILRALEGPWGPHVVSGLTNRLAVVFGRMLPRKLLLALVGRLAS
jgi:short-subunit dehydrogenase